MRPTIGERSDAHSRAGAVVVFFYPDSEAVARANRLSGILPVVVVDNTPASAGQIAFNAPAGLHAAVVYLANAANVGIAAAQNRGVDDLLRRGFDCALLFDQDSDVSLELVEGLVGTLKRLRQICKVAVVGPAYDDPRLGGITPFVRFGAFGIERVLAEGQTPLEVDFLIASGSCIDLSAWRAIGPMDAALFIDFVDLEWCVRAKRAGFGVFGLPWLVMRHRLGEEPAVVLGRRFAMHSAFRHYFLFRNALALILYRRNMPLGWKLSELKKLPVRLVIYPIASKRPGEQIRMIARGVFDGIRNRLGPLRQGFTERQER
ncbi:MULTISPECIES: glycosyltransferase family 2 protein [unclassified Caballeronia]|uniref:glycosyltransferase family 2 protein n=1 Tax=unclassified Caballeronia TaxID=2646786 RepID=UPI002028E8B6|nr:MULTISPECIES: glycosyltransferase family 2 protein [unclassified Caballeronia]MDR5804186.1 glycosyltransferase family 2 protein [Caballeronia sp. LZ001]